MYHAAAAEHGVFPVGSGDCFLAGLVSGLKESSNNVAFALALATACASANAQIPGPAVFDPSKARDLAGRVEIREL
jgi:fructose-1-phosphate kinase PfkB-like protein